MAAIGAVHFSCVASLRGHAFLILRRIISCKKKLICVVNVLSSAKELVHYLQESKARFFLALHIFFDNVYKASKEYGIEKLIYIPLFESLGWLKKQDTE